MVHIIVSIGTLTIMNRKQIIKRITKSIDNVSIDIMADRKYGDIEPLQVCRLDKSIEDIADLLIEVRDQNEKIEFCLNCNPNKIQLKAKTNCLTCNGSGTL